MKKKVLSAIAFFVSIPLFSTSLLLEEKDITYDSSQTLSITELLNITKMKNMEEASIFLKSKGYTESIDDDAFYRREVATFWVKNCKVEHGVNCITAVDVTKNTASSVSVLCSYYDRMIALEVYNTIGKDKLLKEMESLGFKALKKKKDEDMAYSNGKDTIRVGFEEYYSIYQDSMGIKIPYLYTTDSLGNPIRPALISKDDLDDLFKDIKDSFSKNGVKLIKKDKDGYTFKKGTEVLHLTIQKDGIWDGKYKFYVNHDNYWGATPESDEYYGPLMEEKTLDDEP